jgi:hypothetical protein
MLSGSGITYSPMVPTYELVLVYRDGCLHERISITIYTAGDICAQIRNTGVAEDHWNRHHRTLTGEFPFSAHTAQWPSRAFVQTAMTGLSIGRRAYLYQSSVGDAAYTAILRRTG